MRLALAAPRGAGAALAMSPPPELHATNCGIPGVSVRSDAGGGVRRGRFFAGSRGDPAAFADAVVTAGRCHHRGFASVAVAVDASGRAPAAAAGAAAATAAVAAAFAGAVAVATADAVAGAWRAVIAPVGVGRGDDGVSLRTGDVAGPRCRSECAAVLAPAARRAPAAVAATVVVARIGLRGLGAGCPELLVSLWWYVRRVARGATPRPNGEVSPRIWCSAVIRPRSSSVARRRRVLASVVASLWLVDAFCCAALAIAAVAAVSPAVLVRLPTAVGGGRCAGGGGGSGAGVRAGVRGRGGGAGISGCVVGLDGCDSAPPAVVAAAARPGPRLSGRVPGCSGGLSGGGRLFRGWPIFGLTHDLLR